MAQKIPKKKNPNVIFFNFKSIYGRIIQTFLLEVIHFGCSVRKENQLRQSCSVGSWILMHFDSAQPRKDFVGSSEQKKNIFWCK